MTAARILELLHELRSLEATAGTMRDFLRVSERADTWQLVLTAIDDRCALLRGVLTLNVEASVMAACELHLAQQQQVSRDAQVSITEILTDENSRDVPTVSRPTIH
jgi:hypothetical protein